MIDLTPAVSALVILFLVILAVKIFPLIKLKLGQEKYNWFLFWVDIAVKAAEKLFQGSGRGEEKNEYVMKFLSFLNEHGFELDLEILKNMVEAKCQELFPHWPEPETPALKEPTEEVTEEAAEEVK